MRYRMRHIQKQTLPRLTNGPKHPFNRHSPHGPTLFMRVLASTPRLGSFMLRGANLERGEATQKENIMIGKLKSLEWEDFGSRGSKAPVWGMASYLVTSWGKSRFEVCESYPGYQGPFIGERFYSSLAEAKSAAQADYERRFSLARC